MRGAVAILIVVTLAGCGAGTGEGLDQNGVPFGSPGSDLSPTFASIQANVFGPICAVPGCHGGAAAQQGLRLDAGFAYANLINVASPRDASQVRVIPGNPDDSFIIHKLEGTQTLGDRMPDGGPYLQQSTIDVIRLWIANGALQ